MPTVTQLATASVYVFASSPTKNYSSAATFRAGTSPQTISYLYFNRPFPLGATVTNAYLEITQSQPTTDGTREVNARRVDTSWQLSKVNHSNRPGVTGAQTSTSLGNGSRGRVWTIDVTPQMQEVSDGAAWYGLRVYTDKAAQIHFFNHKSVEYGPRLVVEYSTAPSTPANLSPAGGLAVSLARPTLGFGYASPDASALSAFQVQMNEDSATFTSPDHDSGEVAATIPQYVVPFDIDYAEDWHWRVRVKNASGEWSDYSAPASFTRVAKGSLAITTPAVDPNNVVTDPTPPFGWSFSGTQTLWRAIVTRLDTGAVLWDSRDTAGVDGAATYPDGDALPLVTGVTYRLALRVTDDVERAATPGDPVWVEATRDFTFELSSSVPSVSLLDAATTPGDPRARLTWRRSEAPDAWLILRDGETVAHVPGPDLLDVGVEYAWTDLTAAAGVHTWEVAAVVNGVTSTPSQTAPTTVTTEGVWLMTLDGECAVSLAGGIPQVEPQEISTVHLPLGARNPVLITQAIFGRRGNDGGSLHLAPLGSESLVDQEAQWDALCDPDRYPRGTAMRLAWTNSNIECFILNPAKDAETEFVESIRVSFDFCELR